MATSNKFNSFVEQLAEIRIATADAEDRVVVSPTEIRNYIANPESRTVGG